MAKFKNVLLIEDDAITRMVCERLMTITNFADSVQLYENPEAALAYLSSTAPQSVPDIIFLDLNMPVMNAWEFLQEYEKMQLSFIHPPIVYLLSSSVNPTDKEKAAGFLHVTGFIEKPLRKENLEEIKALHVH